MQKTNYEAIHPPSSIYEQHLKLSEPFIDMLKVYEENENRQEGEFVLKDLFKEENEPSRRILIQGPFGIGKTTLCLKLLDDWHSDEEYISKRFKYFFYFPISEYEKLNSIADFFIEACKIPSFSKKFIRSFFEQHQEEVLLILEDIHALSKDKQPQILQLLNKIKYPRMTIIITSMFEELQMMNREKANADEMLNKRNFDKIIIIKGINDKGMKEFLSNSIDKERSKEILNFIADKKIKDICTCPFFFHLLTTKDAIPGLLKFTKTEILKYFFNAIVRKEFIQNGYIKSDMIDKIDIFSTGSSGVLECKWINAMIRIGELEYKNLNKNKEDFTEDNNENCHSGKLLQKFGVSEEYISFHEGRSVYYSKYKRFFEFLAAFATFMKLKDHNESRGNHHKDASKKLLANHTSASYVFLGGLLNNKAWILLKYLIQQSVWFITENITFKNILMEVEDYKALQESLKDEMQWIFPKYYSIDGHSRSFEKNFYSSSVHSFLLEMAIKANLIEVFRWNPSFYEFSISQELTISHLEIYLSEGSYQADKIIKNLKCKTLSFHFTKGFQYTNWSYVVSLCNQIKAEEINYFFDKECDSKILNAFYSEFTKRKWKDKHINKLRAILKPDQNDGPMLLEELVKKKKIHDQLYIEVTKREKENFSEAMLLSLRNLIKVIFPDRENFFDFIFKNEVGFSFIADNLSVDGCDAIPIKYLELKGSINELDDIKELMSIQVKHFNCADLNFKGHPGQSALFLSKIKNINWLTCRNNMHKILNDIDVHCGSTEWEGYATIQQLSIENTTNFDSDFWENLKKFENIKQLDMRNSNRSGGFEQNLSQLLNLLPSLEKLCIEFRFKQLLQFLEAFANMKDGQREVPIKQKFSGKLQAAKNKIVRHDGEVMKEIIPDQVDEEMKAVKDDNEEKKKIQLDRNEEETKTIKDDDEEKKKIQLDGNEEKAKTIKYSDDEKKKILLDQLNQKRIFPDEEPLNFQRELNIISENDSKDRTILNEVVVNLVGADEFSSEGFFSAIKKCFHANALNKFTYNFNHEPVYSNDDKSHNDSSFVDSSSNFSDSFQNYITLEKNICNIKFHCERNKNVIVTEV